MNYIPKNIQGIEGDDIPYHLGLLGEDVDNLPKDVYFYTLTDHYNVHGAEWKKSTEECATKSRAVVFYDLVNTGDYEHSLFCNFISNFNHPKKIYLTVNHSPKLKLDGVEIIQWDFMWNRFKSYYTQSVPENLYLHHYSAGNYKLPELDFYRRRNKKFISLTGREYGWRTRLYNEVSQYDGYISNRTREIYLEQKPVIGAFNPVPNTFYLDSYMSIYVESNCMQSNLIHLTEKTFDPLTKGHIILPFANPGSVSRIRDLGFLLPRFVDYSYDKIIDTGERFRALMVEFDRLMNLDLAKLYADHKDVFTYNQQCIHSIPYDYSLKRIFNV